MRVLHFAHCFVPVFGGTTSRLSNLLSDPAHEHFLYVPRPSVDGQITKAPPEEDFANIHVRRRRLLQSPGMSLLRKVNSRILTASVRETGLDLVHGHNPSTFAWAAVFAARRLGLPLVYELHQLPFDAFGTSLRAPLPAPVAKLAREVIRSDEAQLMTHASLIIVQTPMQRDRLVELLGIEPRRIRIIPAGVDEDRFEPTRWRAEGEALRSRLGWNERTVFMYTGYLARGSGLELLMEAGARLTASERARTAIVVLGRGPLAEAVKQQSEAMPGVLEFHGLVDYADMPRYYAAADVHVVPVLPSPLWERSNPCKTLEGMAMEKVVLGSNVSGVTDLVRDGETGRTFQAGDASDLVRKMREILEQRTSALELGQKARALVVAERSWKRCRRALDGIYAELGASGSTAASRAYARRSPL